MLRMDVNGTDFHGTIQMNGKVRAPKNDDWRGRELTFKNTPVVIASVHWKRIAWVLEKQYKILIADKIRELPYSQALDLIKKGFKHEFVETKFVKVDPDVAIASVGAARRAWKSCEEGAEKTVREEYFRGLVEKMAKEMEVEPSALAPDLDWDDEDPEA